MKKPRPNSAGVRIRREKPADRLRILWAVQRGRAVSDKRVAGAAAEYARLSEAEFGRRMSWAATILAHFEQGLFFWVIALIAVAAGLRNDVPLWAWAVGTVLAVAVAIFLTRRRRIRRMRRAAAAADANERLLATSDLDDA